MDQIMKKVIRYIIGVLIVLVFQISVVNFGNLFSIYFNLPLVLLVYISHKFGRRSGLIFALTGGLIYDSLVSYSLGFVSLALVFVALIISELRTYIYKDNLSLYIFYMVLVNIIYGLVIFMVAYFISLNVSFGQLRSYIFSDIAIANIVVIGLIHQVYKLKEDLIQVFNLER